MSTKYLIHKCMLIVAFIALLTLPTLAAAQEIAETEVARELFAITWQRNLNSEQATRFEQLERQATTEQIRAVRINTALLAETAVIEFNFFPKETVKLAASRVEMPQENRLYWFAHDAALGQDAVLTVHGDNMMGSVWANGRYYQILPLGDGLHAIVRIDEEELPDEHPHSFDEPEGASGSNDTGVDEAHIDNNDSLSAADLAAALLPEGNEGETAVLPETLPLNNSSELDLFDPSDSQESEPDGENGRDRGSTITVLVSYTAQARLDAGGQDGMDLLIEQSVKLTNESYANSGINTRLHLVYQYETAYTETADTATEDGINVDLARLRAKNDGHIDDVHAKRTTYGADVVILITRNNTSSSGSNGYKWCGMAKLYPDASGAFGVVRQNCAASNLSFAHEIGHIQGAAHNPDQHMNSYFDYGHGFYSEANRWRTIMSYQCPAGGCNRRPYWSNPDVSIGTTATGTAENHNNARLLNETAVYVSNFHRDAIQDWAETGDQFGHSLAQGDFNNDGFTDLAIGVPTENIGTITNAGGVHIIYGATGGLATLNNQFWTQDSAGIANIAQVDDQFGYAVAAGDFNNDGYGDLAIAAPFEDVNNLANVGVVHILYGSTNGLKAAGSQLLRQQSGGIMGNAETYDHFGLALAAGDLNNDQFADLVVGVPDEGVNNLQRAGAVNVIFGSTSGLTGTNDQLWHQNSAGIEGVVEADDRFGHALAIGNFNGDAYNDLAIAAPTDSVGSVAQAGVVHILFGSANGPTAANDQLLKQESTIGSGRETQDRFGTTLAAGNFDGDGYDDLVVGVPYEDYGTVVDAGMIHILFGSSSGVSTTRYQAWFQGYAGLTGVAEARDRFGAALAPLAIAGTNRHGLVIGSPGEGLSGSAPTQLANGGIIYVLYSNAGTGLTATNQRTLAQSSTGVVGVAEAGDKFGFALASGDFNGDSQADIIVSSPGESIGTQTNAGAVSLFFGENGRITIDNNQFWHQNK